MRKKIIYERDDSLDFLLDSRYRQEKMRKKMIGQLVILGVIGLLVLIFV